MKTPVKRAIEEGGDVRAGERSSPGFVSYTSISVLLYTHVLIYIQVLSPIMPQYAR